MSSKRRPLTAEFQRTTVELTKRERLPFPEASRRLGVPENNLRRLAKELNRAAVPGGSSTAGLGTQNALEAEDRRVLDEVCRLTMEPEI